MNTTRTGLVRSLALALALALGACHASSKKGGDAAPQPRDTAAVTAPPGGPAGPEGCPNFPPPAPPPAGPTETAPVAGEVQATWLGTAGLIVTDGTTTFLIDPFVSRHRWVRVIDGLPLPSDEKLVRGAIQYLGIPPKAPIVATHSHYDHVLDVPTFARQLGSCIIGSEDTAMVARGAGIPPERMKVVQAREPLTLGAFKLTFLESCHGGIDFYPGRIEAPIEPPAPAGRYSTGRVLTVHVAHPRATFVHHASPCTLPKMFDGLQAETIFLGIFGRKSTAEVLRSTLTPLHAAKAILIHFDDFFQPLTDPISPLIGVNLDEFYGSMTRDAPQIQVVTPTYGRRMTLP